MVLMLMSPVRSRSSRHRAGENLAAFRGRAQRRQNAPPHLRGGLPRERDRQDVARVDARTKQIDVAVNEHPRLPRPCRRLQRHVEAGIHGALTPGAIALGDPLLKGRGLVERQAEAIRHSPSGTRTNTRNSRT